MVHSDSGWLTLSHVTSAAHTYTKYTTRVQRLTYSTILVSHAACWEDYESRTKVAGC
jgi:hypothetical protein